MAFVHVRPSAATLSLRHAMTYLSGHVYPIRIAALHVLLDEMSQLVVLYKIDVDQPQSLHILHVLTNSGVHEARLLSVGAVSCSSSSSPPSP